MQKKLIESNIFGIPFVLIVFILLNVVPVLVALFLLQSVVVRKLNTATFERAEIERSVLMLRPTVTPTPTITVTPTPSVRQFVPATRSGILNK